MRNISLLSVTRSPCPLISQRSWSFQDGCPSFWWSCKHWLTARSSPTRTAELFKQMPWKQGIYYVPLLMSTIYIHCIDIIFCRQFEIVTHTTAFLSCKSNFLRKFCYVPKFMELMFLQRTKKNVNHLVFIVYIRKIGNTQNKEVWNRKFLMGGRGRGFEGKSVSNDHGPRSFHIIWLQF